MNGRAETSAGSLAEARTKLAALKVLGFALLGLEANGWWRCDDETFRLTHALINIINPHHETHMNRTRLLTLLASAALLLSSTGCFQPFAEGEGENEDAGQDMVDDAGLASDPDAGTPCVIPEIVSLCIDAGSMPTKCCLLAPTTCGVCL